MTQYRGHCHCKRVTFELEGPPMQTFYCHCSICRGTSGSPCAMIGFWKPDSTRVTAGEPLVSNATSEYLTRKRCPDCGAAIFNAVRSDKMQSNNFMLALIENRDEATTPTHHIYYADRAIDMEDGLPKFDRFKWLGDR